MYTCQSCSQSLQEGELKLIFELISTALRSIDNTSIENIIPFILSSVVMIIPSSQTCPLYWDSSTRLGYEPFPCVKNAI